MLAEVSRPHVVVPVLDDDRKNGANTSNGEIATSEDGSELQNQTRQLVDVRMTYKEREFEPPRGPSACAPATFDTHQPAAAVQNGLALGGKLASFVDEPLDDVTFSMDLGATDEVRAVDFKPKNEVFPRPLSPAAAAEATEEEDEENVDREQGGEKVTTVDEAGILDGPLPTASPILIIVEDWSSTPKKPKRSLLKEVVEPPESLVQTHELNRALEIAAACDRGFGSSRRSRRELIPVIIIEDWSSDSHTARAEARGVDQHETVPAQHDGEQHWISRAHCGHYRHEAHYLYEQLYPSLLAPSKTDTQQPSDFLCPLRFS